MLRVLAAGAGTDDGSELDALDLCSGPSVWRVPCSSCVRAYAVCMTCDAQFANDWLDGAAGMRAAVCGPAAAQGTSGEGDAGACAELGTLCCAEGWTSAVAASLVSASLQSPREAATLASQFRDGDASLQRVLEHVRGAPEGMLSSAVELALGSSHADGTNGDRPRDSVLQVRGASLRSAAAS